MGRRRLRTPMVSQVIDEGPTESSIHVNRNPSADKAVYPVTRARAAYMRAYAGPGKGRYLREEGGGDTP